LVRALRDQSSARIVSLLQFSAPRTERYLVKETGLSMQVFRRCIATLESLKLVERHSGSGYSLSRYFPKMNWELWAFEVKVDHWRRALYQALRYRALPIVL